MKEEIKNYKEIKDLAKEFVRMVKEENLEEDYGDMLDFYLLRLSDDYKLTETNKWDIQDEVENLMED